MTPEARRTHLGLTPYLTQLFRRKDTVALEKELALEEARRAKFPHATSRLNCLYCWGNEASARLAPKFWGNQGRHFNDRYLVEIGVTAKEPPTVVDTRWIDKFVINSNEPLTKIGTSWIERYWDGSTFPWSGEPHISEQPLFECLVDGVALVYGTELRMEAYRLVKQIAPESTGVLEKGRLGVDLCTRFDGKDEWQLGQILPVLTSNEQRTAMQVRHALNLDETLAKSINEKVPLSAIRQDEINYDALKVFERDTFSLPDLRAIDVDVGWLTQESDLNFRLYKLLTSFFLEGGGDIVAASNLKLTA